MNQKFRMLLVVLLLANGVFLISLGTSTQEQREKFAFKEQSFLIGDNVTLQWRKSIQWSMYLNSTDKIHLSWQADAIVSVYIFTDTQYGNFINGNLSYASYSGEFYYGATNLTAVNPDRFYIVVLNNASSPCQIKIYQIQTTVSTPYTFTGYEMVTTQPYALVGTIIILITILRAIPWLIKRKPKKKNKEPEKTIKVKAHWLNE